MHRPARLLPLLALALAAAPAHAQGSAARFEVVGRGPVTRTRTTDLAVFRGVDGRDYALTGTTGGCRGCYGNRVYVWDVTDPANPALTDSVTVDAEAVADVQVNAAGTLAVATRERAASRRNGIVVLDLATPAHPTVAADYFETLIAGVGGVALDGSLAYAVNTGTRAVHVIDLADPRDPREVGRWGLPPERGVERSLRGVSVRDGMAYLAYWDDGVVILDVGKGTRGGTPQKPELVAQLRPRSTWNGREYGSTHTAVAYTNRAGKAYLFVGDRIFPDRADFDRPVRGAGYVHVLDVSRPEKPEEVARFDVPNAAVQGLWVQDDVLYTAHTGGGVHAVDVSGELRGDLRRQRRALASFSTTDARALIPDLPFAHGVQVHNGMVFASDANSGLWIARLVR